MRKLISALVLLGACRSGAPEPPHAGATPASATGAANAQAAVRGFLTAVKGQDLQSMSAVWGSDLGATRDDSRLSREELERREILIMCYLRHDSYHILSEAPSTDGKRVVAVELKRGHLTRTTNFMEALGPSNRWYVENVDLEPLRDFRACH